MTALRTKPDTGTAHTPGPWRAEIATFGGGYAQGFGIFPSAPTVDLPPGIEQHSIASANIAEHSAFTAFYPAEVIEANALLIAAAPELLASVKDAYSMLKAVEVIDGEDGDPWSKALARMETVIAKAEGRS